MLILPLPVLWSLQTSTQKIGLTLTFLTGSVWVLPLHVRSPTSVRKLTIPFCCSGIVTAVLRFIVFFKTDFLIDLTWYGVELTVWTTAESGLYLIAACLPSLRSLLKHIDISAIRSRLLGYSNKMFSRYSHRAGTIQGSGNMKAEAASLEHLHGKRRQASSEFEEDGLQKTQKTESHDSDVK